MSTFLIIVLALAGVVALITWMTPRFAVTLLDRVIHALRAFHWRHEEGRHHAFGGVPLHIEDDGRHVWIEGLGLQRALGTRDSDEVLAARHPGRWRHDERGRLWLRVDAVAERLATMPGRTDPRTQRLRRYFEREVLHPAAARRERATRS